MAKILGKTRLRASATKEGLLTVSRKSDNIANKKKIVRQSQIVQSVMQNCQYVLSHLLPAGNLLIQG